MKMNVTIAALTVLALSCVKRSPDWVARQDVSISLPRFDAATKVDTVLDGMTLQAIRVAAEDFAPATTEPKACASTQAAQTYKVIHRGEIIFVEISRNPEACGGQGHALDGAARYAVSMDGRILRRVLDGEEGVEPLPGAPDGGTPMADENPFPPGPYAPLGLLDAGLPAGLDAGPNPSAPSQSPGAR